MWDRAVQGGRMGDDAGSWRRAVDQTSSKWVDEMRN
jgi:hypothetical protein